jgi:hypothetical protein
MAKGKGLSRKGQLSTTWDPILQILLPAFMELRLPKTTKPTGQTSGKSAQCQLWALYSLLWHITTESSNLPGQTAHVHIAHSSLTHSCICIQGTHTPNTWHSCAHMHAHHAHVGSHTYTSICPHTPTQNRHSCMHSQTHKYSDTQIMHAQDTHKALTLLQTCVQVSWCSILQLHVAHYQILLEYTTRI